MKSNSKLRFVFITLFSFYHLISHAQTYLGALVGIDYTKLEIVPNQTGFRITEEGYKNKSVLFGLRLEQQITNSFFLTLKGAYSKKIAGAASNGIVPIDKIEFKNYISSFTLNWIPVSSLSIGAGISYQYIPTTSTVYRNDWKDTRTIDRKEIGGLFSVGYLYKHFLLELNYYRGFDILGTYSDDTKVIEPINSFGISLTYMLKVFSFDGKKKKGKKAICPKI